MLLNIVCGLIAAGLMAATAEGLVKLIFLGSDTSLEDLVTDFGSEVFVCFVPYVCAGVGGALSVGYFSPAQRDPAFWCPALGALAAILIGRVVILGRKKRLRRTPMLKVIEVDADK